MRLLTTAALAILTVGTTSSGAQDIEFAVTPIGDRILVFVPSEPGLGNSVAIIEDDHVIVVDAPTPAGAEVILEHIREATQLPIRYLINTHWHDDHIWGNQVYADAFPDLQIVAHPATIEAIQNRAVPALADNLERLRATIQTRDAILESGIEDGEPIADERRTALEARQSAFRGILADFERIRPVLPKIAMADRLDLPGALGVSVRHLGAGNTAGDLAVHVEALDVLVVGDLVTHPIPAGGEAPVSGWVGILDGIRASPPATLVPGHGPVMRDLDYLVELIDLGNAVLAETQSAIDNGLSLEEAISSVRVSGVREAITGGDPRLEIGLDRFFIPLAVESAYAELTAR